MAQAVDLLFSKLNSKFWVQIPVLPKGKNKERNSKTF
jgi:hypothetical protein